MKNKILRLSFILFTAAIYSCKHSDEKLTGAAPVMNTPANTFSVNGGVREMNINFENPEFPQKEGHDLFVSYCAMCHSLRYITTQPDFPAKTWKAEVNKMIHSYNVPIDSVTAQKITDYLVSIKSNEKGDTHAATK